MAGDWRQQHKNRQSSRENPERRARSLAGFILDCRFEDCRRRSSVNVRESDPNVIQEAPDDQTQTNEGADRCVAGEEAEDDKRQEREFKDLYCVVEGVRAYNFGLGVGAGVRTRRGD